MSEMELHFWLVLLEFALAAQTFLLLLVVNAPYGRFTRAGWGPTLPSRLAWIIFECPAVLLFAGIFFLGEHAGNAAPLALLALWKLHYLPRTFIYPLRIRESGKRIPLLIIVMAILFNVLNAYVNARWISHLGAYDDEWLVSLPFLAGMLCFVTGWFINQVSDHTLIRLRSEGGTDYKIPTGGLYRWISCPNYFGEILTWVGWAIASWSLAGASFAAFTVANLLPRAIATHSWYRTQFENYPAERHAVIPHIL